MKNNNELALIEASDLSLVENNNLNANQLALILKKTPQQYVRTRPAKGGGTWDYVSGGYVKKCLNLMFGWDWSFEVIEDKIIFGEVVVKGRLTCRSNGKEIVKMQYGNKDIIFKMIDKYKNGKLTQETRPSEIPLSIGNDLKSAATDALKKCASEIGIAADIYNKDDFREVKVALETDIESLFNEFKAEFEIKKDLIPSHDFRDIESVIEVGFNSSKLKLYKRYLSYLKTLQNE
jgi:hypothetical protein